MHQRFEITSVGKSVRAEEMLDISLDTVDRQNSSIILRCNSRLIDIINFVDYAMFYPKVPKYLDT